MAQEQKTKEYKVTVALATVLTNNGRVLLKKRISSDGMGKWTLFGGRLDQGETLAEASAREIDEETGLKLSISRYYQVCYRAGTTDLGMPFVILYNVAAVFNAELYMLENKEPTKCEDMQWFDHKNLPPEENMWDRDVQAIQLAFMKNWRTPV